MFLSSHVVVTVIHPDKIFSTFFISVSILFIAPARHQKRLRTPGKWRE